MTKNKKFITIFLSLSIFLALPQPIFSMNNFKTMFTSILGNEEKQNYKFVLYFDNESMIEDKKLLMKIFNCYALAKVPGISDETIKENLLLYQFYGYKVPEEILSLTKEDYKKIDKYYNKKNVENLVNSNFEDYNRFIQKIVSFYKENIDELKRYIKYLKENKTDDFYAEFFDKIKNRNKTKISYLKAKEENKKQKIHKGKKAAIKEISIAASLINQNKKYIEKITKKLTKEKFKKFMKSCNIEEFFKNSIDDSIISCFPEELELTFSMNYSYLDKNHLSLYVPFVLYTLGDLLKEDEQNKVAQNLLKKTKKRFKREIKNGMFNFFDFTSSSLIRFCPINAISWEQNENNTSESLKCRFDFDNKKELNLIKKYITSKKFKDRLKINLSEKSFKKFKNEIIKKIKESLKLKKEFLEKENVEKQIEYIKTTKKRNIEENKENLKKTNQPKITEKEIKKAEKFLNDKSKIKETAEENFKKMKKDFDIFKKNVNKGINQMEKISFENFKTICDTIELTDVNIENFAF